MFSDSKYDAEQADRSKEQSTCGKGVGTVGAFALLNMCTDGNDKYTYWKKMDLFLICSDSYGQEQCGYNIDQTDPFLHV